MTEKVEREFWLLLGIFIGVSLELLTTEIIKMLW